MQIYFSPAEKTEKYQKVKTLYWLKLKARYDTNQSVFNMV